MKTTNSKYILPLLFLAGLLPAIIFTAAPLAAKADSETPKPSASEVPSDARLKAMALESLLAFNKAVQEKDFTSFDKNQAASAFSEQLPPEKLLVTFKSYIDMGVDISSIKSVQPTFDPAPAINADGLLILKGTYPTDPKPVTFTLKYLFEDEAWKIVGVDVHVAGSESAKQAVPSDEKLKALTLKTLLAFNKAVKDKDFTAVQAAGSAPFRSQVSAAKLLESFKSFVDQEVDISSIKDAELSFDPAPAITADGILILKGSYATEPKAVTFGLKYLFEENTWKILGIDVDTK